MSRAFVRDVEPETIELPDRVVSSHPNLVTAEGLAAIERTLSHFEAANNAAIAKNDRTAIAAIRRGLRYWNTRRSTAKVIGPAADKSKIHFGATVTVRRDDGRTQTFRIVGEDEAEPARGTLSYVSPLARAVLGGMVGDTVEVPGGRPLAASSAMALNPYALPLGHHRGATHDRRYYRLQTDIDAIST
jgi:transcription elongation GreA/GreB family factor